MSDQLDPLDADCCPGTTVLINKLDIYDEDKLNDAEELATFNIFY